LPYASSSSDYVANSLLYAIQKKGLGSTAYSLQDVKRSSDISQVLGQSGGGGRGKAAHRVRGQATHGPGKRLTEVTKSRGPEALKAPGVPGK
jgi:hypothetical protein